MNAQVTVPATDLPQKATKKVFCLSDTHIGMEAFGQEISSWKSEYRVIEEGLKEAHEAWLLGDIFEVILLSDAELETGLPIKNAKDFLRKLDAINPNCKKMIVWGNHDRSVDYDDQPELVERCRKFNREMEDYIKKNNLNYKICKKNYVAIGDTVGVHGHMGKPADDYIPPEWLKDAFVWFGRAFNVGWISYFNKREEWAQNIAGWLEEKIPEVFSQTKHVIFGHIHQPFTEEGLGVFKRNGEPIKFTNTGVSLEQRRSLFNPVMFETNGIEASNFRSYKEVLKERGLEGASLDGKGKAI